jgi:hypothetical protein
MLSTTPLPLPTVGELKERFVEEFTHAELVAGYETAILENGVFTKRIDHGR